MSTSFIFLCLQTLFLWSIVVVLHRQKRKITLIPLYTFIGLLTILTHNLSNLGFSIIFNNWYFLISSFSYFTPLIFAVLLIYLFDGPRATRLALLVIVFTSLVYIFVIISTGLITDTSKWISFSSTWLLYFFWSLLAIIIDVLSLAVIWELLSKLKFLPLIIKVFSVSMAILTIDTFIFVTGVFGGTPLYFGILSSDLSTRFIMSLVGAIFITLALKHDNFSEENRPKASNIWEIFNFHSDLELEIKTLQEYISSQKTLENEITESRETYKLAITGTGAGIWDWNVKTNKIFWSPKFCELLGYSQNEIGNNLDSFKTIIHPDDIKNTFDVLDHCFKKQIPFETDYRLKTKSGKYRWYKVNGIAKYDNQGQAIRMVGSIIDINTQKEYEITINNKLYDLTQSNEIMVGREIKMTELKEEIKRLKRQLSQKQ